MVSMPLLALIAIGLLVTREMTGDEGFLFGAYGVLGGVAVLGIAFTAISMRGDADDFDDFGPTDDDIERVLTHNVASPVIAKSVIEQLNNAELEVEVEVEPVPVVEPPAPPVEPAVPVAPIVLSPSTEVFVNIGRRNKQLNRQMLTLISHLERDELDPEILHGLYELDHLATRMRRNEETLLLLASTRRVRQWSPPVKLENVLRSALAEVERFSRVEIDEVPDVEILGEVASDITHLLAELIDNATEFSHASTIVTVSAHTTLEGVEIEVLDAGHGMDQSKLDSLNEMLAQPPSVDDAPSRRLGLFIAAQIADGMAVDVALTGQRGVGTVATVSVEHELIAEREDVEEEEEQAAIVEALDLLDPVLQLAVDAELAPHEEEELAIASLPSDEDVAVALGVVSPFETEVQPPAFFPAVAPLIEIPDVVEAVEDFPSVLSVDPSPVGEPLPSRIPQAMFDSVWGDEPQETMPFPEVTQLPATDIHEAAFDDATAHSVAHGAESSISAFTSGVARGLAEAEEEGFSDTQTEDGAHE